MLPMFACPNNSPLSVVLTILAALHQNSDSKSQSIMSGLGLLGLGTNAPLDLSNLFVGVNCSPLGSVLGGASACNSKPVCCSGNHLCVYSICFQNEFHVDGMLLQRRLDQYWLQPPFTLRGFNRRWSSMYCRCIIVVVFLGHILA